MHRLYNNDRLPLYDDLLADGAFLGGDDEEVDAIGIGLHVVRIGEAPVFVVGFEAIDENAFHVVHLHFGFAFELLEMELHLSVVWVGNNEEVGSREDIVINIIERADEPIALHDTVVRVTIVLGMGF